jgi:uncharacterized protein with von Willebrand factor type A (vWA) domain
MQDFPAREILSHLLLFARCLKERGLKITPGRVIDAARCLDWIDLAQREDFAGALRANFVSSREGLRIFEELFDQFWGRMKESLAGRILPSEEGEESQGTFEEKLLPRSLGEEPPTEKEGIREGELHTGYSPREVLMAKDFSEFPPEDTAELEREFSRLLSRLAERMSRRREAAARGREMDLRRTLRRAVRHGGEILEIARRRRKVTPVRIIVICDVSGSMDASTRFILRFFFGLQRILPRTETFVFSTRLTRITDILKRNRWEGALAAISQRAQDWSGGTKIGLSLQAFSQRFAKEVMRGSPVIVLISDGWDRGDPELLEAEMKKLKRKSRRIIWLNPLLATPGYQPLAQGMRTALPYIDDFLPANTLGGFRRMGDFLAREVG